MLKKSDLTRASVNPVKFNNKSFAKYLSYFEPARFGRKDMVTGARLATLKPDQSWTEDRDGDIIEVPVDTATISPIYGLRCNDSYTNFISNSEDLTSWNGVGSKISINHEDGFFKLTKLTTTPWDRCFLDLNTIVAGTILNFSFEVKKGGINKGALYLYDVTADSSHKLNYHCFYDTLFETISEEYLSEPDTADLINSSVCKKNNDIFIITVILKIKYDFQSIEVGFTPKSNVIGEYCYLRRPQAIKMINKMPYVPTAGTIKSSPAEYATATTGSKFLLADIPKCLEAFQGSPSRLDLTLYNGYDLLDTVVSSNFLNPNEGLTFLKFDGFKTVSLTDGTNTVSQAFADINKGFKKITVLWDNSTMQLIVDGVATARASFKGSFNPEEYLNFFWNNKDLWYLKGYTIRRLNSTDWS